eukprot:gene20711-biopygen1058
MAGVWRGLQAFLLAWVAQTWRGHDAGVATDRPVTQGKTAVHADLTRAARWHSDKRTQTGRGQRRFSLQTWPVVAKQAVIMGTAMFFRRIEC